MKITVNMIMGYGPCGAYPRERVEALWAGRESLSFAEMRRLDGVPPRDLVYAGLHLLAFGGQFDAVVRLAEKFADAAQAKRAARVEAEAATRAVEAVGWAAWAAVLEQQLDLIEAEIEAWT